MMSMEEDDELLQDFLIDAGEILEQLTQQVVDLEKTPDDKEIINAVFRGFHTIKGGASFLALDPLVALCHRTEDVFNVLRNGERDVDEEVMDVVLPVLDVLKDQFSALSSGKPPREAEAWILEKLDELASPGGRKTSQSSNVTSKKRNTQISSKKKKRKTPRAAGTANPENVVSVTPDSKVSSDLEEINDDEFEALLDQFQNQRQGVVHSHQQKDQESQDKLQAGSASAQNQEAEDDSISEEEFDAILDAIQKSNNKGKTTASNKDTRSNTNSNNKSAASKSNNGVEKVSKSENVATAKQAGPEAIGSPGAKTRGKDSSQTETTVRVDTKRLDDIMNLVGELVLVRNRMTSLEGLLQSEEMSKVVGNLDIVTADLQSAVMKTRMQPIKKVFGRFPRVVRDL
ncbi:Hpt domain-containing protein, partial [Kaarinaea lacus]